MFRAATPFLFGFYSACRAVGPWDGAPSAAVPWPVAFAATVQASNCVRLFAATVQVGSLLLSGRSHSAGLLLLQRPLGDRMRSYHARLGGQTLGTHRWPVLLHVGYAVHRTALLDDCTQYRGRRLRQRTFDRLRQPTSDPGMALRLRPSLGQLPSLPQCRLAIAFAYLLPQCRSALCSCPVAATVLVCSCCNGRLAQGMRSGCLR